MNVKHINDFDELSKQLDNYLIINPADRLKNAEVATPYQLRNDMLDLIPDKLFKNENIKVLDPCCGKCGFIIDIINRFMNGLNHITNKNKRYKIIVENILHFCDINNENINTVKSIIDPDNQYNLNYYVGDSLKMDFTGFDIVISNPPYNASGRKMTGNTLYCSFTKQSLLKWLKPFGHLLSVHPPGWRKPCCEKSKYYGMKELITADNTLIYLNMNDIDTAKRVFGCSTKYDYFLVNKTTNNNNYKTRIFDYYNQEYEMDLTKIPFIPGFNINHVLKYVNPTGDYIYNQITGLDQRSYTKHLTHKSEYPVITKILKNRIDIVYVTKPIKPQQLKPKILFNRCSLTNVVIDMEGIYQFDRNNTPIYINEKEEAEKYKRVLLSKRFKTNILKPCMFSIYLIDQVLFYFFNKKLLEDYDIDT